VYVSLCFGLGFNTALWGYKGPGSSIAESQKNTLRKYASANANVSLTYALYAQGSVKHRLLKGLVHPKMKMIL